MRYEPYNPPLVAGRLVRRYKRFLADVELEDGRLITAHCPNSGSMMGMSEPGSDVMVRHVPDPKRKLKWTWELVRPPGTGWVGCNTARPNDIVRWAIETGQVPGLSAATGLRTEVKYGRNSRIDILLGPDDDACYVEVKNTTLAAEGVARFPDAVTARGAKHMQELADMVAAGHRAVVVFLVNRADCRRFEVARDIDATYAAAFDAARAAGVEAMALGVTPDPDGWAVHGLLPIRDADP